MQASTTVRLTSVACLLDSKLHTDSSVLLNYNYINVPHPFLCFLLSFILLLYFMLETDQTATKS